MLGGRYIRIDDVNDLDRRSLFVVLAPYPWWVKMPHFIITDGHCESSMLVAHRGCNASSLS